MNIRQTTIAAIIASSLFTGCTRIETGEVGLRVGFDKQVSASELLPGSFNQTLIGEVLTFPTKDVAVQIENITPLAKDNSTMSDVDAVVIYSINPQAVAELYVSKNKTFHTKQDGDTLLMYSYMHQAARNAIYKAMREYEALAMSDKRPEIEQKVKEELLRTLSAEKLDGAITVSQVQVRNISPAASVIASANELVRAKNDLVKKEVEVRIAEEEARRMAALTNQSKASIDYMHAQAVLNISEGVKAGKVQTIVIPADFKGIVNTGK